MYTSTAKEQRVSSTKFGVHGELSAIRHGLLRRDSTKLGLTVRTLEKERKIMLNIDQKDRDGLLQRLALLQSKLGVHTIDHNRSIKFSSLPRPLVETRELSRSLSSLSNASTTPTNLNENYNYSKFPVNRPSTSLPRQLKISRQRLEELSRPKSAMNYPSCGVQPRESKKRRSSKHDLVVKVNRSQHERIDVNKSPTSTPSDSPKLVRTRTKSTIVAPNMLDLMTSDDLTHSDIIATTQPRYNSNHVYRKTSSSSFELALGRTNGRGGPGSTGDSNNSMSSNSPITSGRTSPISSSSVFDDNESISTISTTPRSIMRGPKRCPNSPRKSISFALDSELTTPERRFSCHSLDDRDALNSPRTRKLSAQSIGQQENQEYENYWTWEALTRNLNRCRYLRLRDDCNSNDDIIDIDDIFDKSG